MCIQCKDKMVILAGRGAVVAWDLAGIRIPQGLFLG